MESFWYILRIHAWGSPHWGLGGFFNSMNSKNMSEVLHMFWYLATFNVHKCYRYSSYTWRASDIFLEFMLEEVLIGGLGAFDMWTDVAEADDGTGNVASVKGGGVESEHAELLSRLLLLLLDLRFVHWCVFMKFCPVVGEMRYFQYCCVL